MPHMGAQATFWVWASSRRFLTAKSGNVFWEVRDPSLGMPKCACSLENIIQDRCTLLDCISLWTHKAFNLARMELLSGKNYFPKCQTKKWPQFKHKMVYQAKLIILTALQRRIYIWQGVCGRWVLYRQAEIYIMLNYLRDHLFICCNLVKCKFPYWSAVSASHHLGILSSSGMAKDNGHLQVWANLEEFSKNLKKPMIFSPNAGWNWSHRPWSTLASWRTHTFWSHASSISYSRKYPGKDQFCLGKASAPQSKGLWRTVQGSFLYVGFWISLIQNFQLNNYSRYALSKAGKFQAMLVALDNEFRRINSDLFHYVER